MPSKKKRKKLPHETNRWQVFSFSNNKTNQPTGRATMNKKKSKKKRNETTSKEKRKDKKTRKSKENYGDPTNAGLIHCAVPVSLFVSSEICWPFFSHTIMSNTLLILVIRLLSKLLEVPSLLNVFPLIIIACFFFSKINFNFDSLSIWNAARKCVMRRTTKWRTKNRCGFCFVCFFFSLIVACCFAFLSPLMWRWFEGFTAMFSFFLRKSRRVLTADPVSTGTESWAQQGKKNNTLSNERWTETTKNRTHSNRDREKKRERERGRFYFDAIKVGRKIGRRRRRRSIRNDGAPHHNTFNRENRRLNTHFHSLLCVSVSVCVCVLLWLSAVALCAVRLFYLI